MSLVLKNSRFLLIALIAACISCDPAPTKIRVVLYGQGAGFSGLYRVDGDDEETSFSSSESTSDVYEFSVKINIKESISIDVFPNPTADDTDAANKTDMTALTCRIYDASDATLYEETYSISSTNMKTFSFNLDDI